MTILICEPKYPLLYISMKIMGNIDHSYLIDNSSNLNLMSKIIMGWLNVSCINKIDKILTFCNNEIQPTIFQIKVFSDVHTS